MTPPSEDDRYVEYLQRDICTPEWEEFFSAEKWRQWYATNLSHLQEMAETQGCHAGTFVREIERLANEFRPRTLFEVPDTSSIFEPLLEEIKRTAQALRLLPTRDVRIATSTDVSVTPRARPTSGGEHLLFIGLGTSTYCNYWAKAFTAIVKTIAAAGPPEPVSSIEDLQSRLNADLRGVALAARLALHYGFFGTTMGFGEVRQPADYLAYRLELLRAMETFALGHEYCHFIAEERLPEMQGVELELFCDALALQISRNCAYPVDSWLAFAGIGPLVLFRSLQLCDCAREQLIAARPDLFRSSICQTDEHPPLEDRILAIKALLLKNTTEDQREAVRQFLEEYDGIAQGVIHLVSGLLGSAIEAQNLASGS